MTSAMHLTPTHPVTGWPFPCYETGLSSKPLLSLLRRNRTDLAARAIISLRALESC